MALMLSCSMQLGLILVLSMRLNVCDTVTVSVRVDVNQRPGLACCQMGGTGGDVDFL